MKISYLEEFLELAETRNYTMAAENMFISESSLSRHIIAMEKALNTTLFVRNPKSVTLTESGILLLNYARQITKAMDEYTHLLTEKRLPQKNIAIGICHGLEQYGFADKISDFCYNSKESVMMSVKDNSETLWKDMVDWQCNFVVCFEYPSFQKQGVRSQLLLQDEIAAVLPADHPFASMEKIPLSLLSGERFLIKPPKNSTLYHYCLKQLAEAGCEARITAFAGSHIYDFINDGVGIGLLEKRRYESTAPSSVKFVSIEPKLSKNVVIAYRNHELTASEKELYEYIVSLFAEKKE